MDEKYLTMKWGMNLKAIGHIQVGFRLWKFQTNHNNKYGYLELIIQKSFLKRILLNKPFFQKKPKEQS